MKVGIGNSEFGTGKCDLGPKTQNQVSVNLMTVAYHIDICWVRADQVFLVVLYVPAFHHIVQKEQPTMYTPLTVSFLYQ